MEKMTQREIGHLIQEMKQGSEAAFEILYETYMPFIFSIAFKLLKKRQEAEDVCHEIFLEFLKHPERYDPQRGSLESWLAIKTKSKCLDILRSQKKRALNYSLDPFALSPGSTGEDPTFERTLSNEIKQVVAQALERIPSVQRDVLHQVYFQGQTQRTVASQMNRPLGTIKSLIRYGLKNMKKELINWEDMGFGGGKKGE